MTETAPIGVIGGTGFYRLIADGREIATTTPYGDPSGPLHAGVLAGRQVVFVPRHGPGHRYPPHLIPYRANLWALREAGVRQVFSVSAVGSLDPAVGVGALAVPDQLLDRTWGREHTFYDAPSGVHHISFADPYCPALRAAARCPEVDLDGGTLVVINGPRFSTRAESADLRRTGAQLIGMTAMPEAALARELGLCYATLALVTDLDAGVAPGEGVSEQEVLATFAANIPRLRGLLERAIGAVDPDAECGCADGPRVDH